MLWVGRRTDDRHRFEGVGRPAEPSSWLSRTSLSSRASAVRVLAAAAFADLGPRRQHQLPCLSPSPPNTHDKLSLDERVHFAHAERDVVHRGERKMATTDTRHPGDHESPRFLSVQEAARILRLSPMTLYRAIEANAFPAIRVRNRIAVPARAIDEMEAAAVDTRSVVDAASWTATMGR